MPLLEMLALSLMGGLIIYFVQFLHPENDAD
jgi:hypothetical protein